MALAKITGPQIAPENSGGRPSFYVILQLDCMKASINIMG
jgi:hypothetical protein